MIVFVLFLVVVVILNYRAMRKKRGEKNRQAIARKLYKASILAQTEAVTGVQEPSKIVETAQRILPLDIHPDTEYVKAAMGMRENQQDFYRQAYEASMQNEFLQIQR